MRLIDPETTSFDTIYAKFQWAIPDRLNTASQVCERHQSDPNSIAVYYENSDGETAIYSFGQLKTLSDQFANALKGLGVDRGDRVAIVLSQRIETVIAHLAGCRPLSRNLEVGHHYKIPALTARMLKVGIGWYDDCWFRALTRVRNRAYIILEG